jgi:hypothetical protein
MSGKERRSVAGCLAPCALGRHPGYQPGLAYFDKTSDRTDSPAYAAAELWLASYMQCPLRAGAHTEGALLALS